MIINLSLSSTSLGAVVTSLHGKHMSWRWDHSNGVYDIFFQVWRPSPTVQDNGCYSLMGENRFTSIFFGNGGLVSETPEPSNIISVQPGDVVGYYTFSRRDADTSSEEELQLETSYSADMVLYFTYFCTMSYCTVAINPFFSNAGPVLNIRMSKMFVLFFFFHFSKLFL